MAVFNNSQGSVTTTLATLSVSSGATVPVITSDPTSQSVTAGNTVTFTAASSGNSSLWEQWQVSTDGGLTYSNIANATSPTYSSTASASQNGDEFRAVFSNLQGSVISSAATLSVTAGTTGGGDSAPVIATNPTSQTVSPSGTVTFAAAAAGTPPPIVIWQVSTDGGQVFSNIPDATSANLSLTATTAQTGEVFKAVFNNALGSAVTAPATLTVGGA
jgi:plastocyanin